MSHHKSASSSTRATSAQNPPKSLGLRGSRPTTTRFRATGQPQVTGWLKVPSGEVHLRSPPLFSPESGGRADSRQLRYLGPETAALRTPVLLASSLLRKPSDDRHHLLRVANHRIIDRLCTLHSSPATLRSHTSSLRARFRRERAQQGPTMSLRHQLPTTPFLHRNKGRPLRSTHRSARGQKPVELEKTLMDRRKKWMQILLNHY